MSVADSTTFLDHPNSCPLNHSWFLDRNAAEPAPGSWGVVRTSIGAWQIRWVCPRCGARSKHSVGHMRFRAEFGDSVEKLPVILDNRA